MAPEFNKTIQGWHDVLRDMLRWHRQPGQPRLAEYSSVYGYDDVQEKCIRWRQFCGELYTVGELLEEARNRLRKVQAIAEWKVMQMQ